MTLKKMCHSTHSHFWASIRKSAQILPFVAVDVRRWVPPASASLPRRLHFLSPFPFRPFASFGIPLEDVPDLI